MAGIIEVKDQGKIRIYDADNSNYIDIVVPSTVSSNRTITLPDDSFTVPTSGGVAGITSSADGTAITIDSSENVSLAQNLSFNSGFGSATTVYGVRAWVNFNGTGTLAIRDSGGVSSVTDNGTGSYTPNFSTNMPDSNYVTLTNNGPVISTGSQKFYFTSSNQPDAVGSVNINSREVDNNDGTFASADNAYVGMIAIR